MYHILCINCMCSVLCCCCKPRASLVFQSIFYCVFVWHLNSVFVVESYNLNTSQYVSAFFFQEILSGCQVRSCLYPPGTWSESLSVSASQSAWKVQNWQSEFVFTQQHWANTRIRATVTDNKRCLVDKRVLQICLDAFAAWKATLQEGGFKPKHFFPNK